MKTKSTLILLIITTYLSQCLSISAPLEYHYISSDRKIHSGVADNGLVPERDSKTVAVLLYKRTVNITGWADLELKTFDGFPDELASYLAGYLEAYVTGDLIEMSAQNNAAQNPCQRSPVFCERLKQFIKTNAEFLEKMIEEKAADSDYWRQLKLVYEQLRGLEAGYSQWKREHGRKANLDPILTDMFILHLYTAEIGDLEQLLTNGPSTTAQGHCSALVKPLANGRDLYVSHNSWEGYTGMLRVMKKYSFAFNSIESNGTRRIAGHSAAFSSYPGLLFSLDDYYVLSSGLVVMETTLTNLNPNLWKLVPIDRVVFEFVRTVVANRLAASGREWTDLFSRYNSGTYNNEFMVVDYKRFKSGTKSGRLADGLLWVLNQLPGHIEKSDVTPVLRAQGYWASYNIPYFKRIYELSNTRSSLIKYGPFFSYSQCPRARIFRRDHQNVTDLRSLYHFMRYNDFRNDPLSRCALYNQTCRPAFSAHFAISARNDLNDPNGIYPDVTRVEWDVWGYAPVGAVDAKMTNAAMVSAVELLAVCGPTDQQQPAFQWSKTDFNVSHVGQPDLFHFKPIYVKWYPNCNQNANDVLYH